MILLIYSIYNTTELKWDQPGWGPKCQVHSQMNPHRRQSRGSHSADKSAYNQSHQWDWKKEKNAPQVQLCFVLNWVTWNINVVYTIQSWIKAESNSFLKRAAWRNHSNILCLCLHLLVKLCYCICNQLVMGSWESSSWLKKTPQKNPTGFAIEYKHNTGLLFSLWQLKCLQKYLSFC